MIKDKEKLIVDGYLKEVKHPTEDLYLYNYTQMAQIAGLNDPIWHSDLKGCRGLILDGEGRIVARPFSKFWNLEQYDGKLPDYNNFQVFDKLDGSLGVLYPKYNAIAISTRGSFESDQAKWATQLINENYVDFSKAYFANSIYQNSTFLFEIIYPENRIVVDYKGQKDLILLSVVDNNTGKDWDFTEIEHVAGEFGFPLVDRFDGITDFNSIRETNKRDNAEGFVVLFDTGFRVKLKYEEYCRLHRIVTGVSSKSIWEMLKNGDSFEEILECVPDEFHDFVLRTKKELEEQYASIESIARNCYHEVIGHETRKEQAQYIMRYYKKYASIVFIMLDGKPHEGVIWNMLKPAYQQPFKDREMK